MELFGFLYPTESTEVNLPRPRAGVNRSRLSESKQFVSEDSRRPWRHTFDPGIGVNRSLKSEVISFVKKTAGARGALPSTWNRCGPILKSERTEFC